MMTNFEIAMTLASAYANRAWFKERIEGGGAKRWNGDDASEFEVLVQAITRERPDYVHAVCKKLEQGDPYPTDPLFDRKRVERVYLQAVVIDEELYQRWEKDHPVDRHFPTLLDFRLAVEGGNKSL